LDLVLTPGLFLWRLNTGSKLVKAEEIDKGTVLRLPRGWSNWRYLDCQSARFDQAKFDQSRLPEGGAANRLHSISVALASSLENLWSRFSHQ